MTTETISTLQDTALDYALYMRCGRAQSRARVRRGRVEFLDGTPFNPSINPSLTSVYIDAYIMTLERDGTLPDGVRGWFARTTQGHTAVGRTYMEAAIRAVVLTLNDGQDDVYIPNEIKGA